METLHERLLHEERVARFVSRSPFPTAHTGHLKIDGRAMSPT